MSATDGWLKLNFTSCVLRKTRSLGSLVLLRRTTVIRACDQHEKLYIVLFVLLITIFGPDYYVPR